MGGEAYTRRTNYLTHGRTQIDVVYTNEEKVLKETLDMYERWLRVDDFVDLDLEYTKPDPIYENTVAIAQLAMHTHVVVYHYSWYVFILHILFFSSKGIYASAHL